MKESLFSQLLKLKVIQFESIIKWPEKQPIKYTIFMTIILTRHLWITGSIALKVHFP
jgi:hypothetical protein